MKTFLVLLLSLISLSPIAGQAVVHIESGVVSTGYNDVRIPGEGGTLFSLSDDLAGDAEFYYRLRASYTIGSRHTVSALLAPLAVSYAGVLPYDIDFAGESFSTNTDVAGEYKFNSYRLTYRYELIRNPRFDLGLGLTAKIRDARIALSSDDASAEKTDFGFVPLINFRLMWRFHEKLGLLAEGDALAAPQGRAEDALIAAVYSFSDQLALHAGYRILEGGADNEEVYNFSLFNYASLGVKYRF